jgi:carboxypeptidase C (cathepsin A)
MKRALARIVCVGLVATFLAAIARAAGPGDIVTSHRLELPGRTLAFDAAVGFVPIRNDQDHVEAQAGFVAFLRADRQPSTRPVTFVVNGGPGAASAYLNLGALGPWRVALDGGSPSARAPLLANADTWLDLTDLVFIDPPGTGFGPPVRAGAVRNRLWSVTGDIDALADVIAQWLVTYDRLASPKVLLGQSYGGLRVPRMADALRTRRGVAVNGLVLLSPVLDYGWRYHARTSPLSFATLLPSFAAARLEREGRLSPEALAETESYAAGDFFADFLRGPADEAAVERLTGRVAAITGLSIATVRAVRGRVDEQLFEREAARAHGQVVSSYDASVRGADPDPGLSRPDFADPFMATLKAPLATAMAELLGDKLGLKLQRPYEVLSETVFDAWDFGHDGGMPEAVTALRKILALDPALLVLVGHGYTDLQAPYFETKLLLDQLPDLGDPGRLVRKTYPGGHVFYSRDASRAALRQDAEAFYLALPSARR